jgi:very-short-patch-repair endonuclease
MGKLGGFELLASDASDYAHRKVMMLRDMAFGDSPIEQLFAAALMTVAEWQSRSVSWVQQFGPDYPLEEAKHGVAMMGMPSTTAFIEKQVQVAGWRVDFLIHYPLLGAPDVDGWPVLGKLIVECDGHAYHERTKEQAARDRQRDRVAQHQGLPVFRFTGSEIWNDPVGCADEVLQYIESGPEQTR